ncbi:hypothetical protein A0H81_10456 [Grifola frondosa]|uniref:Uncharacterized protein n=1 Tax=Grifola frondosa TaxID=5627 RepID=A0A1C7M0V9_GRIFR|nr:hypothetical protein A0H81_10456 [Grifola frondosa]
MVYDEANDVSILQISAFRHRAQRPRTLRLLLNFWARDWHHTLAVACRVQPSEIFLVSHATLDVRALDRTIFPSSHQGYCPRIKSNTFWRIRYFLVVCGPDSRAPQALVFWMYAHECSHFAWNTRASQSPSAICLVSAKSSALFRAHGITTQVRKMERASPSHVGMCERGGAVGGAPRTSYSRSTLATPSQSIAPPVKKK